MTTRKGGPSWDKVLQRIGDGRVLEDRWVQGVESRELHRRLPWLVDELVTILYYEKEEEETEVEIEADGSVNSRGGSSAPGGIQSGVDTWDDL